MAYANAEAGELTAVMESPLAYAQLEAPLRRRFTEQEYEQHILRHNILRCYPYRRLPDFIRGTTTEEHYYQHLMIVRSDALQLYPYSLQHMVRQLTGNSPTRYYRLMLQQLLAAASPYDRLPNLTALDVLRLLGVGRNEYLQLRKAEKGGRQQHWPRRGFDLDGHVAPNLPPTAALDWRWRMMAAEPQKAEGSLNTSEGERAVLAQLRASPCLAGELHKDVVEMLYRRHVVWPMVRAESLDVLEVPPLQHFVMNRATEWPYEQLLYRLLFILDGCLTLQAVAQLLLLDVEEVCAAAQTLILLGLARPLHDAEACSPPPSLHESWPASAMCSSCGSNTVQQPPRRVALLYDSTLAGHLMMSNLSTDPAFKQLAMTLFEVGRLRHEYVELLLQHLRTAQDQAASLDTGEAHYYIGSVRSLRIALEALRQLPGPGDEVGRVDLIKIDALNALDASTRCSLLHSQYWCCFIAAPVVVPPSIDVELGAAVHGSLAGLVASPWLMLFLAEKMHRGPPSVLLPYGSLPHSWPSSFVDRMDANTSAHVEVGEVVGHLVMMRVQALLPDAEVRYINLATSLLFIAEMSATSPVMAQCPVALPLVREENGSVGVCHGFHHGEVAVPLGATEEEILCLTRLAMLQRLRTRGEDVEAERLSLADDAHQLHALIASGTDALGLRHTLAFFVVAITVVRRGERMEVLDAQLVSVGLGLPMIHHDCCASMLAVLPKLLTADAMAAHREEMRRLILAFGDFLQHYANAMTTSPLVAGGLLGSAGAKTDMHLRDVCGCAGCPLPTTSLYFDGACLSIVDDGDPLSEQW